MPARRTEPPAEPPAEPSPRSPERQALADAIEAHRAATEDMRRAEEAYQRTHALYYEQLMPAVRDARRDLKEARQLAPAMLVDAVLSERAVTPPDLEAEDALRVAETKLAATRVQREVLAVEQTTREQRVHQAAQDLDAAVTAAVRADPARRALVDEFNKASNRALRCAKALWTSGMRIQGSEAHGLRFHIAKAAAPVGVDPFEYDSDWSQAIAALRQDPDAPLPGLPPEE